MNNTNDEQARNTSMFGTFEEDVKLAAMLFVVCPNCGWLRFLAKLFLIRPIETCDTQKR